MTVATATSGGTSVVVSESGAKGLDGTDGTDGIGFNQVRQSKLDNPLLHLFKSNQLSAVSAPLNTDADVTWTRASTATYVDRYGVVQSAAIDTPREESEGWLIEGASTNLCLQSEDFATTWTNSLTAEIVNAVTSPDGATTADKIEATTTATAPRHMQQSVTVTTATAYTHSVFAKAGEVDWLYVRDLGDGNVGAWFDLTAGAVGTINAGATSKIESFGDGWYRCSMTNTTSSTSGGTQFNIGIADNTVTYSGTLGEGLYLWGAQVEALPFASSYIPTTTASVTRAADLVNVAINNNVVLSPTSVSFTWDISGATSENSFLYGNGGGVHMYSKISSLLSETARFGDQIEALTGAVSANTTHNTLYTSSTTQLSTYRDGVANDIEVAASGDGLGEDTIMSIGSQGASYTSPMYGHIKDFRIYDFALNADEAQYLAD